MTLNTGKIHETYNVVSVDLPFQIEKRLQALGMTLNTSIEILQKKNNGTLVINLRGTRFALGKDITKRIEVKPCQKS